MLVSLKALYKKYYQDNLIINRFTRVFSLDILVKGSSFLLLPVYLKLMTQEEFGVFTYIYSMIITLSLLLSFLYIAQSKYFHDYTGEERKSLLFTINVLLFVFVFGSLMIVYLTESDYLIIQYVFTKPIPYEKYREVLFLGLIVTAYGFMLSNYFLTSENIVLVQRFNYMKLILENGVVIVCLVFLPGDQVFVRLFAFYGINLFIFICFAYFYFKNMRVHFDFQLAGKSLYISLPVLASSIFGIIFNFSDKFIIEKYCDFKEMAVYNLGFTISAIIPVFIVTFQNIWLPLFFKEKSISLNLQKTNKMAMLIFAILFLSSITVILVTKVALEFQIIGLAYKHVMAILPFQFAAQAIFGITQLYKNYFAFFEKAHFGTLVNIVTSLIVLSFNIYLIPRYQIVGASVSMLLVSIIEFAIILLVVKRLIRIGLQQVSSTSAAC